MDTAEVSLYLLEAMEALLCQGEEPDEARLRGEDGMAICDERQRSLVERGGAAHADSFPEAIL
jgi:hypothetical protein